MKVRVCDIRASGSAGLVVKFAPGPQWFAAAVEGADVDTTSGSIGGELVLLWTEGTISSYGRVDATLTATCGRCLAPVPEAHTLNMKMVLLPKPGEPAGAAAGAQKGRGRRREPEVVTVDPAAADDEEVSYFKGDDVDVGELVREALLLALPAYPLCKEDCAGLCPHCGADRNQGPCGCVEEVDSPFAGLRAALDRK
jgi:uncharacterized protein